MSIQCDSGPLKNNIAVAMSMSAVNPCACGGDGEADYPSECERGGTVVRPHRRTDWRPNAPAAARLGRSGRAGDVAIVAVTGVGAEDSGSRTIPRPVSSDMGCNLAMSLSSPP